jgi:hypothetical protein
MEITQVNVLGLTPKRKVALESRRGTSCLRETVVSRTTTGRKELQASDGAIGSKSLLTWEMKKAHKEPEQEAKRITPPSHSSD